MKVWVWKWQSLSKKKLCDGYVDYFLKFILFSHSDLVLVSKVSDETSSEIKNKYYKILQECNNTGEENSVMFIWPHDLAVVRIDKENKSVS